MASYCFIANYHLAPLQLKLARCLEREGTSCVFITVNGNLAQDIAAAGWCGDRLLYLTFDPVKTEPVFDTVKIRFNDLVVADRALRHQPDKGLLFLYRAARDMLAFFELHDVRFVFSEPTWAHERLAAALCAASEHRTFLTPFTIRYPAGHVGFFENGDQDRLYPLLLAESNAPSPTLAEVAKSAQPAYLQRNDQLLKEAQRIVARFDRLRRFITRERIHPLDPTHIQSRWQTLRINGAEEINRWLYRFVRREVVNSTTLESPFVIYALHKQPESSIDVLGRYYEDQAALLLAIWRTLPADWTLLVKEHSNAIGDRSPAFYRRLQRWPGLWVIDERTPMSLLIEHARAVFTVSGTVAYEAALRGVPAFTFAPMFFNKFNRCRRITVEDLRAARDLAGLIEALPAPSAIENEAALKKILHNAFAGRFTDIVSDPTVLDPENIEQILAGFRALSQPVPAGAYM